MHHALRIEEILHHIFAHCYILERHPGSQSIDPEAERCLYSNAHLATLARTCKAFKEPALSMIWAELDDLSPLVRCLDQSWATEFDNYALRNEPLLQAEWDTVLTYARRVKSLPRLRYSLGLTADCIKALSNPPTSTTLFPNLREIRLYWPNAEVAPLVPHLASPSLMKLSLELTENVVTAIKTFGERCPNVSEFSVIHSDDRDTVWGFILGWKNLQTITSDEDGLINIDSLFHLSGLRDLCYMDFVMDGALVDQIQSSMSLCFQALRNLRIATIHGDGSLISISQLLCHLRLPAISALSVEVDVTPTIPDLKSFFSALQNACTENTLTNLTIHVYMSEIANMPMITLTPSENPPLHYITSDFLRPLISFANVTNFILDIPYDVDLNEDELLSLASSWPCLESLKLGDNNRDWKPSSGITPMGFLKLLERCKSLRKLSFKLDSHGYTEIPQGHPWRGLSMPQHTVIDLRRSPVEEESIEALAVFFHVAPYPTFTLNTCWPISGPFELIEECSGSCHLYHGRWERVRSLARGFWEQRKDLRRSIEVMACAAMVRIP